MLPSLVRLADYMISESLVSLVLNNLSDLLSLATPTRRRGCFSPRWRLRTTSQPSPPTNRGGDGDATFVISTHSRTACDKLP